jgi:hypothetical protein
MSAAGQPKPELVAALIEELELAINWLDESNPPPSADEARERLRTLREAATAAGASAIEGWLADLANEPFESRESGAYLARLAQASRMLSEPYANRELDWLGENSRLAGELEYLAAEWRSGSERLGHFSMLLERCVTTLNERERADLSSKLTQKLCEEIQVQRFAQRRLLTSVEALRRWAHEFSRERTGAQRVLLAPRLAAVRTWVQIEASRLKLNITWHLGTVTVERDHVEPLTILLRELFEWIVSDRQEPLHQPHKKNAAPPLKLNLHGEEHARLLTMVIEADTDRQRPAFSPSSTAKQALATVRGRLTSESSERVCRLTLQVVESGRCEDVVPVHSQAGLVLLPVWMVKEVFSSLPAAIDPWPRISLPQASPEKVVIDENTAVLIEIGSYSGLLPGRVTGVPFRAVVDPPASTDPPWIQGRAHLHGVMRPVMCLLPLVPIAKRGCQIYPLDNSYGGAS